MRKKVVIALLFSSVVLLGAVGVYYFSYKSGVSLFDFTFLPFLGSKKSAIFELGPSLFGKSVLVDVSYSSLSEITKTQAEQLANVDGITFIGLHNPEPDKATQEKFEELSKTKYVPGASITVGVLAGRYIGLRGRSMAMVNNSNREYRISFTDTSRLWINDNNALKVVSAYLPTLISTADLSNYLGLNDLVLAVYVTPVDNNTVEARYLLVFR